MTPLGRTAEEAYADGYIAGCATGNGYMEAVDAELKALRLRVEILDAACVVERRRAEQAEAQAVLLTEENAALVMKLREQIAGCLRLI